MRAAGDAVCRMGRTRGAQYSLRCRTADLPPRIPVFLVDCVGNLVIGESAFERFQTARGVGAEPLSDADYPARAEVALERPAGGRLPAATFDPGPPGAADLEVWPAALRAAIRFWRRTVADERITVGFRTAAQDALDRLRSLERL